MSEHERGDRVLLRARVDGSGPSGSVVIVADHGTVHHVDPADLIPDDRRPAWLPGQPGDVAEFGDVRAWCIDNTLSGKWWGIQGRLVWKTDDDVPADAVLVLPAKTREATS